MFFCLNLDILLNLNLPFQGRGSDAVLVAFSSSLEGSSKPLQDYCLSKAEFQLKSCNENKHNTLTFRKLAHLVQYRETPDWIQV